MSQQVTLTEDTFIHGVLTPAGTVVNVDLEALGVKKLGDTSSTASEEAKSLTPNLAPTKKAADPVVYEVAAVSPTGPNPENPQAVPPGTKQISDSYMAPAGEDGAGVKVVAEGSDEAEEAKTKRGPGRPKSN